MNRRQFLHSSVVAAGTLTCAGLSLSACASDSDSETASSASESDRQTQPVPNLSTVGLQLYTIRSVLEDDFRGTMEKVAAIGYDEVEFAGYYDRSPDEISSLLDELGLAAPAAHVPLERIRKAPASVVETASAVGHQYIVCPFLSEEDRSSLDAYRERAKEFTEFGKRCSDAGLQFAYHNHDFEFTELDGTVPYDVLLEESDPEHVKMELDLYWVIDAGKNPLAYIKEAPDRYPLCHVKDRTVDGEMTSVGSGSIVFANLFDHANFEHYFVEHDNPENPMQSVQSSYEYLSAPAS